jgi:hypothetical protein
MVITNEPRPADLLAVASGRIVHYVPCMVSVSDDPVHLRVDFIGHDNRGKSKSKRDFIPIKHVVSLRFYR